MAWTLMMIEAHCMYHMLTSNENYENVNCCSRVPGKIGLECFHTSKSGQCKYLGVGKSSGTVAVTDETGNVISFSSFFSELELSSEEWISTERKWCEKWAKRIKENGD